MKKVKKDYPEYTVYRTMIYSCYPSKNKSTYYERHSIGVCDRWRGPDGFWNFLGDLGRKPSTNHRLRRRNTKEDFCPENCEWSLKKVKNYRDNVFITLNKITKTLKEWCKELDLDYGRAYYRYINKKEPYEILNRGKGVNILYEKRLYSIKDFCEKFNLKIPRTRYRLKAGWDIEDIIHEPNQNKYPTRREKNPFFEKDIEKIESRKRLNKIKKTQQYKEYFSNFSKRINN